MGMMSEPGSKVTTWAEAASPKANPATAAARLSARGIGPAV